MNHDRKRNRIILGAVFVLIALLGIGRLTTGGLSKQFGIIPLASNLVSARSFELEAELPIDRLNRLSFTTVSSDITFRSDGGETVRVTLTGKAGTLPELLAESSGGEGRVEVRWKSGRNNMASQMRMTVLLPARFDGTLSCTTVSGDITLSDNASFDEIVVKSVSGDLEGSGLDLSRVTFSSVSGDMQLHSSRAASADIGTTSGKVEIEGEAGDLVVRTVSGDGKLTLAALAGDIEFRSTSGNLTLVLGESPSAALRFSTTTGDLQSKYPLTLHPGSSSGTVRKEITGTIGSGTWNIVGSTVSGDIDIR